MMELRTKIWNKLASIWKPEVLEQIYSECVLQELSDKIDFRRENYGKNSSKS
jgi:hypothetical protein